jgi:hypothetical protein
MKQFYFLSAFLLVFYTNIYPQGKYEQVYEQLKAIEIAPFDEQGDSLYWEIVIGGLTNMPALIELLDNSDETGVMAPFGQDYSIADLAYNIITDIIYDIPTLKLIEDAGGCLKDESYYVYWNFLKGNDKNRKWFKETVKEWYAKNKDKLIWHKTDMNRYNDFIEIQSFKNPAGGYYLALE